MTEIVSSEAPGSAMKPHLIASGLGLSGRKELCGLLALFEAAGLMNVGIGAAKDLVKSLGAEVEAKAERIASIASELEASNSSDDELRHMLWLRLQNGLGVGTVFSLSERQTTEISSALGVMSSRVLSPALIAKQQKQGNADKGAVKKWKDWLEEIWQDPKRLWNGHDPLPFPKIVAHELASLLDGVQLGDDVDPHIAKALDSAGQNAWGALAAGGGWAAMAATVNAAGFAPYILALVACSPFLVLRFLNITVDQFSWGGSPKRSKNVLRCKSANAL